jgi:hypothetical protein
MSISKKIGHDTAWCGLTRDETHLREQRATGAISVARDDAADAAAMRRGQQAREHD